MAETFGRRRAKGPRDFLDGCVLSVDMRRVLRHQVPPLFIAEVLVQSTENPAVHEESSLLADDLALLLGRLNLRFELATASAVDRFRRQGADHCRYHVLIVHCPPPARLALLKMNSS
ncbi:hypothetical protein D9M73_226240 [compost metagenome]